MTTDEIRLPVAIIDDEPAGIDALSRLIDRFCPELQVIGTARDAATGFELLTTTQPRIVFLDIEMPDKSGFELLNAFEHKPFDVVFCTGHDHYAIKAIRYAALDYLLKPIDPIELKQLVARVRRSNPSPDSTRLGIMRQAWNQAHPETIALPTLSGHIFKSVAQITRLEAVDNYTRVHFAQEMPILVSRTLKAFQDILPAQHFVRLHRSHLVRRSFIRELQRTKKPTVILADGHTIPVSLDKKDDLFDNLLSV